MCEETTRETPSTVVDERSERLDELLVELGQTKPPTTRELYRDYGYEPSVAGEIKSQKGLDFEPSDETRADIAQTGLDILTNPSTDVAEIIEINGGLRLEISKYPHREGIDEQNFKMRMADENGEMIADFTCRRKNGASAWLNTHRFVAEEYRSQQIGSRMFELIERTLQELANAKREAQELTIPAHQIGAVNFAIRNAYFPRNEEDWELLRALYGGDTDRFMITTARGFMLQGIASRPGYIFEMAHLARLVKEYNRAEMDGPEITEVDQLTDPVLMDALFSRDPFVWEANAATINLSKTIKPAEEKTVNSK